MLRYGLAMRFLVSSLFLVASILLLAPMAHAQFEVPPGPLRMWPAVDIDGGVAYASGGTGWTYFGRAQAGLHLVNRHKVAALTGGFEMLGSAHKAFALRADFASITNGFGAGAGVTLSTHANPGFGLGVSWSVVRLEGMFVFGDHSVRALIASLRLPLGLVAYRLWGPWK